MMIKIINFINEAHIKTVMDISGDYANMKIGDTFKLDNIGYEVVQVRTSEDPIIIYVVRGSYG